jgi:hypothetical protein
MKAVTTFAPHHYDEYAHRMLESFVKFWPCTLVAYVDYIPPFEHKKIEYRIIEDARLDKFKRSAARYPVTSYLNDAGRFAHKVFAQLDAFERDKDREIFWLDADVVTLMEIHPWFLKQLVREWALCFLGRDTYTETGFIGFNTEHTEFGAFRERYEAMYTNEEIFSLRYWTDCHAFDESRRGMRQVNDIGKGHGLEHVWCKSILAPYMDHTKGPRKEAGYSPEHPITGRHGRHVA